MPGNQQTLITTTRQEQQLSARQLQSLELLNLPILELEQRIAQELIENPLLEAVEVEPEVLPDPKPNPEDKEDESTLDEKATESDEWFEELPIPEGSGESGATNEENDFMMNSLFVAPTLREQLLAELSTCNEPPEILRLAGEIIDQIDDSGYFRSTVADLAMSEGAELADVETALHLVQSFDPPGIGCRDLAECLKLQLERVGELTPIYQELLDHHLEDIAHNRLPSLAHQFHISIEELNQYLARLRRLNPFPGSVLAPEHAEFIMPEAKIVLSSEGKYEVIPRKDVMPRLFLADRYVKMLETPDLTPEVRSYLRDKLQQAKELMRALDLRQSTIIRLAQVIASTQQEFLEHGVKSLKPLTMKQAGEMLELHETTISRTVANKYIETPQGIYPFRFFFSSGFTGEDGEAVSNRAVMEKLKELIAQENPTKPCSDEQLAKLLKEDGLVVARRTVAKYREALGIPPSSIRRKHT